MLAQAVATVVGGKQVLAEAPPQVELVVSQRPCGEFVFHLINHSGHQERSFHDALPIFDIGLSLDLPLTAVSKAQTLVGGEELMVTMVDGRVQLRLPRLDAFEVIVIAALTNG